MNHLGFICLFLILICATGCKRKDYPTGEAVYEGECAKCHILNGKGGDKGPDLTGILEKKSERYVRDYTVDPRSIQPDSTMPPSDLDEKHLEMLMDYLRKNAQSRPPANQIEHTQR